jgi:hypothetical protein
MIRRPFSSIYDGVPAAASLRGSTGRCLTPSQKSRPGFLASPVEPQTQAIRPSGLMPLDTVVEDIDPVKLVTRAFWAEAVPNNLHPEGSSR